MKGVGVATSGTSLLLRLLPRRTGRWMCAVQSKGATLAPPQNKRVVSIWSERGATVRTRIHETDAVPEANPR